MPSLSISASKSCQAGGGVITVSGISSVNTGYNITAVVLDANTGLQVFAFAVGAGWPQSTNGLFDGEYEIVATEKNGNGQTTATSSKFLVLNCGFAPPAACTISAVTTAVTNATAAGTATGSVTITATAGGPLEYRIGGGAWQTSNVISGLLPNNYTAEAREQLNPSCSNSKAFVIGIAPPVRFTCKDPIALNYDATGDQADNSLCLYAPPAAPKFEVPILNSLRFVIPDNNAANFDNKLFCEIKHTGISRPNYYQQVEKEDSLIIQWYSNYGTNEVVIKNFETGVPAVTIPGVIKSGAVGVSDTFLGWLASEPGNKTRIYFNSASLPVPFRVNDVVTLFNTGNMDGVEIVTGIFEDMKAGAPYLVINRPYLGANLTKEASIRTNFNQQTYKVYEAVVNLGALPNAIYQAFINVSGGLFPNASAKSEPFNLATSHANTVLIQYRSLDNAYDMQYTTGYIGTVRIHARLWELEPGGKQKLHIEPSGRAVKISATLNRLAKLETFMLPQWLNEKLAFIFGNDFIAVNGVEYQTEEIYKANTIKSYALASGSIMLQQAQLFKKQNGTDFGDIDSGSAGGFIITNGGRLKV